MLFEQFGQGLVQYSKANPTIKNIIKKMNKTLAENGNELNGYLLIEQIEDPYLKDTVLESYNNYLEDKNAETRENLIEALEPLFMVSDPIAMKMQLLITEDSSMSSRFINTNFINESDYDIQNRRIQEAREKRQADMIIEKVIRHFEDKLDEDERLQLTEKAEYCLEGIANKNGINLFEEINTIAHSDAGSNERLMEVLSAYKNALNQGAYEERLYETFIQNVSKFNYLLPVDKAIKSIVEKVDTKQEEITLTKLLEMMKDDAQAFIYVDLIQEDVARYVKHPNPTNRIQLRNALMPYASDPLINEMFNVLYADNTRRSNELSEKALNIKDQINIIRENASVSNLYSPVQYIRENECVFNVRGQYFVKKGNNIAILDEKYIDQLNEKFTELCHLVNDPHVEINDDCIKLYGSDKYATIYEGYVDIMGVKESQESLRNLREMCMKYEDYDTNFYIMCSCLLENFNNIAKIDWAKHVTLNENNNINIDLFKLDQNIFMSTHNDALGQHTFYRNINPIFCKNKMNEHMGINVSSLFTDLLPNQDKIILKLNETKNAYEDAIQQYKDKLDELTKAKDVCSEENKKELEDAINDCEQTLKEYEAEYKEWQEKVSKETGKKSDKEEDDEENVIKEPSNEPIKDEEVDAVKDELSQPITGQSEISDEEVDTEVDNAEGIVTDQEFDNFLNTADVQTEGDDDYIESGEEVENSEENDSDEESIFDTDDEENTEEINLDSTEEDEVEDVKDTEEFKEVDLGDELATDSTDVKDADENDIEGLTVPEIGTEEDNNDNSIFGDEEPDGTEATDIFGGDTEDPFGENKEDVVNGPINVPDIPADNLVSTPSYNIASVMFDENLKAGVKSKSGSVVAIVPMVDGTGKTFINNMTIHFYIDDNNNPILNNESMTADLYKAVVSAIKSDPNYEDVCKNGGLGTVETSDVDDLNVEGIDAEDPHPSYFTDEEREETGFIPTENEEQPIAATLPNVHSVEEPVEEINMFDDEIDNALNVTSNDDVDTIINDVKEPVVDPIQTYTDGDTEIEFPANNVDDTTVDDATLDDIIDDVTNDSTAETDDAEEDITIDTEEDTEEPELNIEDNDDEDLLSEIEEALLAESRKTNRRNSLKESIKITPVFKNKSSKKRFF